MQHLKQLIETIKDQMGEMLTSAMPNSYIKIVFRSPGISVKFDVQYQPGDIFGIILGRAQQEHLMQLLDSPDAHELAFNVEDNQSATFIGAAYPEGVLVNVEYLDYVDDAKVAPDLIAKAHGFEAQLKAELLKREVLNTSDMDMTIEEIQEKLKEFSKY